MKRGRPMADCAVCFRSEEEDEEDEEEDEEDEEEGERA